MAKHGYYTTPHWKALRRAALARDGYRCTVPGCRAPAGPVDHIETRPPVPYPTEADRLDNLRWLCASHDAQIKEQQSGQRRRGGRPVVKGSDVNGWLRQGYGH
jgi:5-methylcytosine-specific restriction enzyme A